MTSFSVPISSIEFWEKRLNHFGVEFKSPQAKFQNASVIACNDRDSRSGYTNGHIPLEHPIKGFYGVEIWEEGYERTAGLLTGRMDHSLISEESNRFRFVADDSPGQYIDIVCAPDSLRGLRGGGTVHHIAFATSDTSTQLEVRTKIIDLNPTPLIDRQYFKSVYFREPGGVLFEIATMPPGFSVDEDPDQLGTALKLPPQYGPIAILKNIDRAFVGRSSNAMGLQNATARKLAVPDLTTTVLTLTIVGIAADGHLVGESGPRAGRRFISVAAMFMGGFIGSLFILHGSIIAPLVIAFTVMAVIALYARARANKNPVWVSDSETLGVDGLIYAAHAFSSF